MGEGGFVDVDPLSEGEGELGGGVEGRKIGGRMGLSSLGSALGSDGDLV